MIADLLPRYYEQFESNLRYETLRSVMIDGHEVAWMRYSGARPDGSEFTGYSLKCECEFAEGTGWYWKDGHRYSGTSFHGRWCVRKQAAMDLRIRELRELFHDHAYHAIRDQYTFARDRGELIGGVILRLKAMGADGEWLGEDNSGAGFYGGYFYLGTVERVLEQDPRAVREAAERLAARKQIALTGAIVCEYREPPSPQLIPVGDPDGIVQDGYRVKAWQPANDSTPHEFVLRVWRDGDTSGPALAERTVPMGYPNAWGVDVADMAALEAATDELLADVQGPS